MSIFWRTHPISPCLASPGNPLSLSPTSACRLVASHPHVSLMHTSFLPFRQFSSTYCRVPTLSVPPEAIYHLLSSPLYSRFKQEEFLKGVKSSHWLSFLLWKPLQPCVAVVSCPNPRVCFVVILCFDLSGWFVFVSCLAICGSFILSPSPCGRIVFALCLGPRGRLWLLWLSYGCLWLWCLQ